MVKMKKRLLLVLFLMISGMSFAQNADIRILRAINSTEQLPADHFMIFVSNSNNAIVLGIPITMGVTGLIKHDQKLINCAGQLVVASAINLGATLALKYSINRDRPFVTYPDINNKVDENSPSFPSGHTSSAFATATSLSLNFPKWYVIVPSYLWAGTVGYSRMYLGVHYPSDVLGGMIVGAGSAFLTFKLNNWLNKNYSKKHGKQQERIR